VSAVSELGEGLSGLQQLQGLMAAGRMPGIGRTMGFTLVEVAEGFAAFEGRPDEGVYNPIGTVHGGYAAALLDSACGCAIHSTLSAEQAYTTLELKVAYHRAMTSKTGLVRAEGRVVTIGRRAGFAEAKLLDKDGRLYASATSSLLVMSKAA
jgi:uncharacterized protein (TIGR00369 family)